MQRRARTPRLEHVDFPPWCVASGLECHLWGRDRVLTEEERVEHIVFTPFSVVSMKCVPLEGQVQTHHVSGLGTKESVSHTQQGRPGCRRLVDVRTATPYADAH